MKNEIKSRSAIPNLFIVGQPKSGTTALHNILNKHPQVYMSPEKEPDYFCTDFHFESDKYYKRQLYFHIRDEEEYLELFSNTHQVKENVQIIGESSVNYLYSKNAAKNIYNFNPDAKIIIVLRHPVDYIYSLHRQFIKKAQENQNDFLYALSIEDERKKGKHLPYTVMVPSYVLYKQRAMYYKQVKRFTDIFGPSQVKIILYEDFKHSFHNVIQEIFRFLDIDQSYLIKNEYYNENRVPRSITLNKMVQNPFLKKSIRTLLSLGTYNRIKTMVKKVVQKKKPYTPLDVRVREQLINDFNDDIESLSSLMQADLRLVWGLNSPVQEKVLIKGSAH